METLIREYIIGDLIGAIESDSLDTCDSDAVIEFINNSVEQLLLKLKENGYDKIL